MNPVISPQIDFSSLYLLFALIFFIKQRQKSKTKLSEK